MSCAQGQRIYSAQLNFVNQYLSDNSKCRVRLCVNKRALLMIFAFINRMISDQDGEGRIELMLAAQVVIAALAF
tara:strand:+ start:419 stop:640 length:222 start_codon:yes stop_codon:yes gene_type:complete